MLKPELIADIPCDTGEGPLWHPDEGVLYWVDIPGARLYRYRPASGRIDTFETGAAVGGMTLQADGHLLLFMARGAVRTWHDGAFTGTILESLPIRRGVSSAAPCRRQTGRENCTAWTPMPR